MYTFQAPTNKEIQNTQNRSKNEIDTSITDQTLDILSDIAKSNNMLIITRPVNSMAFVHMKAGAVGKNMFVHGKSASPGTVVQGLIPMQSSISKAGDQDDVNKIKKFSNENKHSIENSERLFKELESKLESSALALAKEGSKNPSSEQILERATLSEAAFDPLVSKVALLDKNGNQLYIFEDEKGRPLREKETRAHVYAIKDGEQFRLVDKDHEIIDRNPQIPDNFKPQTVEVMGKPDIEITNDGKIKINKILPITADIDMLSYGTKVEAEKFASRSYATDLYNEKSQLIKASNVNLPANIMNMILVKKSIAEEIFTNYSPEPIEKTLQKSEVQQYLNSLDNVKLQQVNGLMNKLKDAEKRLEHLRGMGEGSSLSLAVTGHLREAFKGQMEVSHGPEQFNVYFTQPLDSEWVSINNQGKISVIKGEEELRKVFSQAVTNGFNMPPNPNWGWRFENGEYKVDNELRNIIAEAGRLTSALNKSTEEQKAQIYNIIDLSINLGIAAISTDTEYAKKINSMKSEITSEMDSYYQSQAIEEKNKSQKIENQNKTNKISDSAIKDAASIVSKILEKDSSTKLETTNKVDNYQKSQANREDAQEKTKKKPKEIVTSAIKGILSKILKKDYSFSQKKSSKTNSDKQSQFNR